MLRLLSAWFPSYFRDVLVMLVAILYMSIQLIVQNSLLPPIIIFFIVSGPLIVICMCSCFFNSSKNYYRSTCQPGVWCCALLPFAVFATTNIGSKSLLSDGYFMNLFIFLFASMIGYILHLFHRDKELFVIGLILCVSAPDKKLLLQAIVTILAVTIFILLQFVPRCVPSSFSMGEAVIVSLAAALFLFQHGNMLMFQWQGRESIYLQLLDSPLSTFTWILIIFSLNFMVLAKLLRRSVIGCFLSLLLTGAGCLYTMRYSSQENLLLWFLHYCLNSYRKVALLAYWCICALVSIAVVYRYSQRRGTKSKSIIRKIFHFITIAVYLPGLLVDPELLHLASVCALVVFLVLEFVRSQKIPPLSAVLESSFEVFRDKQDSGDLILTHIYLLIGFSCPLWLWPTSLDSASSELALYSGVLSLGIGDTAASIGGILYGHHKWQDSQKSVEGTTFAAVSQLIFCALLKLCGVNMNCVLNIIVAVLLTSFMEAFTSQIDNLVLPLLMFGLLATGC